MMVGVVVTVLEGFCWGAAGIVIGCGVEACSTRTCPEKRGGHETDRRVYIHIQRKRQNVCIWGT